MYASTVLNTKLSAIISILSGIGFITVLSITPLNPPKKKEHHLYEKEDILPLKRMDKKAMVSLDPKEDREKQSFLSIKSVSEIKEDFSRAIWGSGFANNSLNEISPFFFDNQIRENQSVQPDILTHYKDEKISVNAIVETRSIINHNLEYKFQNKMADQSSLFQQSSNQFKNLEMNYQINSSISANFKSTQFDIFDDKLKQYPTTMAGLSYTGNKLISTGFIAGESTLNNPYRNTYHGNANSYGNTFYRELDMPIRDSDRANKNLFEWQANITPTKNLQFQTAVFNSNRSLINEMNTSEGARVAMAIWFEYFALNFKYNYLSDNLMRTVLRPDAASMFNKDYAAFGFTFFLDRFKRYSVYIGNNYYNITTLNQPTDSINRVPINNSFSASIRGKNNDYYNTTFFLNFKNNTNRDYFYSNIGVFRLPVYSQLNFEFATSLGLELSF